ncbi:MAG: endonuclease I [Patiriisocius sp.]|jgi:endonuclease I
MILKTFRKFLLVISMLFSMFSIMGQGVYYNGVDFNLEGIALKNDLAGHMISNHTTTISYSTAWDVLMQTDHEPGSGDLVRLIYGSDDSDASIINDYTRDENLNGGNVGDWNREHVYPKSLGTPTFSNSGPGSDAHHLRSCDVQMNSTRNNHRFIDGSGTANYNGTGWYPGDEWKGDCARIMMYMYLRYGNQCLPINVGIGQVNSIDQDMIDLFLTWNAIDDVSPYELQRNDIIEGVQGNRNPFIDNPAIASKIWGGDIAADPWGIVTPTEIVLNIIAFLEGPFDDNTQRMSDNLRINNSIPLMEPFTALGFNGQPTSTTSTMLNVIGDDAITDWIYIELRDPQNPNIIIDSQSALIKRNGEITDATQQSSLTFDSQGFNEVVVAIRHRNHFGVRTLNALDTSSPINIDFSDPSFEVYGVNARIILNSTALLISGDANGDGTINAIDKNIFWRTQNGQAFDYILFRSDFNLDGTVNSIDKNIFWRANNSKAEALD